MLVYNPLYGPRYKVLNYDFTYVLTTDGRLYIHDKPPIEVAVNYDAEYPYWLISIDGHLRHYACHRFMADNLIPKRDLSYDVVNHKDGNKLNFKLENLEWTNHKENTLHAIRNNLCSNVDIEKVHIICELIKKGYSNIDISRIVNTTPSHVSHIRCKKRHKQISDLYF